MYEYRCNDCLMLCTSCGLTRKRASLPAQAINYGNWMWLSCSCFFYQYFRCYSPVAFPKKYDKEGEYVRHWLPCLKNMPAK